MENLDLFNISKGDIITITGGGGKTSLLYFLADFFSNFGTTLISTTTKIFVPKNENYIFITEKDLNSFFPLKNKVYIFIQNIENDKITSIKTKNLECLNKIFDFIFLEGDGSNHKCFKGWKTNEPCIPKISTKVIAVLDIQLLGRKKDENTIHRFDLYKEQFKYINNSFDISDYIEYIDKSPLFSDFRGDKYIFFNKIDSRKEFKNLVTLCNSINFKNIYFGSLLKEKIFRYKSITPIFLAAGFSRRFNENKLLFKLKNGKTILENTISPFLNLNFKNSILIGREKFYLDICKNYSIRYIENKNAHLGQSTSVILGCLNSDTDGFLFIPSDMPFLTYDSIIEIIYHFQKYNEIIVPKVENELLAPVIFPKRYKEKLLELKGDKGGKSLLKTLNFIPVNFFYKNEFFDIDKKTDLNYMEDIL